jgi:D-tyrosyl-tRNA(Tyr) deacylase
VKAVASRVASARVTVAGEVVGEIGPGLLVLVGVPHDDGQAEADWIAGKLAGLRVFDDDAGRMNRAVTDTGGGVLVVSSSPCTATPGPGAARPMSPRPALSRPSRWWTRS